MTDLRFIPDMTSSYVDATPIPLSTYLSGGLRSGLREAALIVALFTFLHVFLPVSVPGEESLGGRHLSTQIAAEAPNKSLNP